MKKMILSSCCFQRKNKLNIKPDLISRVLEVTQDDSSYASSHHKIQESNSEITEFWWDSLETKKFQLSEREKEIPKLDSLEGYEDFIDNAYFKSFGSLTVSPESQYYLGI